MVTNRHTHSKSAETTEEEHRLSKCRNIHISNRTTACSSSLCRLVVVQTERREQCEDTNSQTGSGAPNL